MCIVHVITGLPKAAGTSVFCGAVCNELVSQGHVVILAVCNLGAANQYLLDSRVKLVSIRSVLQGEMGVDFDVVHVHAMWTPILHKVSRWAQRNGLPVVWSPHGMLAPWAMKHKWWKKCLPWYLYQKYDLKRAKLLHATSEQEKGWIERFGFDLPVIVVPLGTMIAPMAKISAPKYKTLLFVGRLYPVKAIDNLIKAFARVPEPVRWGWILRLVGPDQAGYQKSLELIVKSLGLRECVKFIGAKFGTELNREYDECDCLALVSHTENFGATVVDAMAHGKPVLTGDKTPWKEVLDFRCGWWVSNDPEKLSEAISEMMSMSDYERWQMGVRGRKLVEAKYTWSAVVKEMVKGYEEVLDGRT